MKSKIITNRTYINKLLQLFFVVLIMMLLLGYFGRVYAQAVNINTKLNSLQEAQKAQLESYAYSLLPTIYIKQGQSNNYGSAPYLVANIDADVLSALNPAANPDLAEVQFIKINVHNGMAAGSIDMSQLATLSQLQYVLVEFNYSPCTGSNCAANAAAAIVSGSLPNVQLLYDVSIPN